MERWFRDITDKAIRRGVFPSVPDLIAAIEDYLRVNNADPKPFMWTASAESILEKVRRGRVALEAARPPSPAASGFPRSGKRAAGTPHCRPRAAPAPCGRWRCPGPPRPVVDRPGQTVDRFH